METLCGIDGCHECQRKEACAGCVKTGGHPFGGSCVAAECVRVGGRDRLRAEEHKLIEEINGLGIKDLKVDHLNLLNGFFVNLEFSFENGKSVKFLKDEDIYWGNQVEIPGSDRCYGFVADREQLLICTYGCEGKEPQLVLYKKREMDAYI